MDNWRAQVYVQDNCSPLSNNFATKTSADCKTPTKAPAKITSQLLTNKIYIVSSSSFIRLPAVDWKYGNLLSWGYRMTALQVLVVVMRLQQKKNCRDVEKDPFEHEAVKAFSSVLSFTTRQAFAPLFWPSCWQEGLVAYCPYPLLRCPLLCCILLSFLILRHCHPPCITDYFFSLSSEMTPSWCQQPWDGVLFAIQLCLLLPYVFFCCLSCLVLFFLVFSCQLRKSQPLQLLRKFLRQRLLLQLQHQQKSLRLVAKVILSGMLSEVHWQTQHQSGVCTSMAAAPICHLTKTIITCSLDEYVRAFTAQEEAGRQADRLTTRLSVYRFVTVQG